MSNTLTTTAHAGHPSCVACGLHKQCRTPFMNGVGPSLRLLIVGEAPGNVEDNEGEPFLGAAGKLLRTDLRVCGFDPARCRITNAVRCAPPNNKLSGVTPINLCRTFLAEEIARTRPTHILVLGNTALRSVLKVSGITNRRRSVYTYKCEITQREIPVVAAFHPAFILRNMDMRDDFRGDLRFFRKVVDDKLSGHDNIPVNGAPTAKDIRALHKRAVERGIVIGYDVEATTLEPYVDASRFALLCVGVSDGDKQTLVLRVDDYDMEQRKRFLHTRSPDFLDALKAMRALMRDPNVRKVAHNERYDRSALRVRLNWDVRGVVCDTLLLHAFVKAIGMGHDLDSVSAELLGRGKHKHLVQPYVGEGTNPERFSLVPWDVLSRYNGLDCWVTARVVPILQRKLDAMHEKYIDDGAKKLLRRVNVKCPPKRMFAEVMKAHEHFAHVEQRGLQVDVRYAKRLRIALESEIESALDAMRALRSVRRWERERRREAFALYKGKNDARKNPRDVSEIEQRARDESLFNPNSAFHVAAILYERMGYKPPRLTDSGLPSTDNASMQSVQQEARVNVARAKVADEAIAFIDALLRHRSATKHLSTYVDGPLSRLDASDRVHASWNLSGARTGRLSCKNPNLQNQPANDTRFKRMYIPSRDGLRLCQADYSQIELRTIAAMSGDSIMRDIYAKGRDLHEETARTVFNVPKGQSVSKEQRRQAKAVNFGIVYGESALSLAEQLGISVDDAGDLIEGVLEAYPGMNRWRIEQMNFAKRHGYVYTLTGRKRPLENAQITRNDASSLKIRGHALRQAVNTPVQGTASDVCLIAYNAVCDAFEAADYYARVLAIVHDSLLWESDEDAWKDSVRTVKRCMERAPFEFIDRALWGDIPLAIDFETSRASWGDLKPVRFHKGS